MWRNYNLKSKDFQPGSYFLSLFSFISYENVTFYKILGRQGSSFCKFQYV